ncbi:A disintegrin and metalloproteinase with thrombospondin motifs 2-like [Physella acuta]|uniref:A disintegrin and metalloproteinase with thrombospondin motifs 2-like n=1 Tax=Physella acuta TaxID=109671 RepID=UPI0027DACFD5|nr:A disintegrin and metalloproteinase with thrombospondin motifs 2-like [Physella acuta]
MFSIFGFYWSNLSGHLLVCCILALCQTCTLVSAKYGQGLPCRPVHQEISFPRVRDVNGKKTSIHSISGDTVYVTLTWRRRRLDIVLHRNELTSPGTYSQWSQENVTYAHTIDQTCFYYGYLANVTSSSAAITTCDGLAGYIQTDRELLFLQPGANKGTDGAQPHVLYTCEPEQSAPEPEVWSRHSAQPSGRKRRAAAKTKYLEVLVVVDHMVQEALGSREKTESYVMTLMNIANTVYQHHSLGQDIRVVVVKILLLDKSQQRQVVLANDPLYSVNLFCRWSQQQIPAGQPMDYDVSVLLTKESLGPSGYAPITDMCNPARSCAVIRDEGFTAAFVIAHEIAHVFGVFHDGHGNECHGRKWETALMATLLETKLNNFWWSECSRARMKEVLQYITCLDNEPRKMANKHYPLKAPATIEKVLGKPWSLNFQCSQAFGPGFQLCAGFSQDPCNMLWCSHQTQPLYCRTKRGPPIAGSVCGTDRECRNESCQYVGKEKPVNGNWGSWGSWTACSTACGVGIKQRTRVCDRPAPAYGGKSCDGEAEIMDTCKDTTCRNYVDTRKGECAVWDLLLLHGNHSWQPFEGLNDSSLCLQTCKSSHTGEVLTINVHVSDGTACSYTGNNSNICMDGACVAVGCDGKRNSTLKEDMCGMCGGTGSECKTVRGTFNKKPSSGQEYIPVITIPENSRNIEIIETKLSGHFLAIEDPKYGTLPLNGEKRQSKNTRLVINGAMFEYKRSGPNSMESITSPGPLRKPLQVLVFTNNELSNTSISFSYVVHKSDFTYEMNNYKWKFENWSACSVTCGKGVQTIIHGCYHKDTDVKVDLELCALLPPPRKDTSPCALDQCGLVRYLYAMDKDYSECVARCGEKGYQQQKFHCERQFLNNQTFEKTSLSWCQHLVPPNYTQACMGQPCSTTHSFQWRTTSEWSKCSCGDAGVQTINVTCVRVETVANNTQKTESTVPDNNCKDVPGKPSTSRSCQGQPCQVTKYRWANTFKYSECSTSCGPGVKSSTMVCERVTLSGDQESVEEVDEQLCAKSLKPYPRKQSCENEACEEKIRYQWLNSFQNSTCSQRCGLLGLEHAELVCHQLASGNQTVVAQVASSFCSDLQKPEVETRTCQLKPCPEDSFVYRWSYNFQNASCNAKCGESGEIEPTLTCLKLSKVFEDLMENVEETFCTNSTKPYKRRRTCTAEPCQDEPKKYVWHALEEWTACLAECDQTGTQTRLHVCQEIDPDGSSQEVKAELCDGLQKENTTRTCHGEECPHYWTVGEWSECSVTCGKGAHYRKIYCADPDTDYDDVKCKDEPPAMSISCTREDCPQTGEENCVDLYSFCTTYKGLKARCKRDNFLRKCCRTCMDAERSAKRSIKKRGLKAKKNSRALP